MRKKLVLGSVVVALIGIGVAAMSRSSGQQATTQPTLAITPEAQQLLNQVKDAYGSLKSLGVSGKMVGHFDIDGMRHNNTGQFDGLYSSTGHFRSEMKDSTDDEPATTQPTADALVGNTGEKVYLFLPLRNKFIMIDAPKGKVDLDSLGADVADILRNQDLSLALAVSGDASAELLQEATSIAKTDDVKIDGRNFPTLLIVHPQYDIALSIDPQTHLLRRATADLSKNAKLQGAKDVKAAQLTMDYVNSPSEPAQPQQFAWAPPPGAQELAAADGAGAPTDLEGKTAPPFTLTGLDGKQVSTASLKGSVYVLDVWATWCGPCVNSLPHLDAIYKDAKTSGVKFFAINEQEDKEVVQKFVTDTKLGIPVLLDSDGKVGEVYDTDGAIPFTIVVGKDGKVKKAAHMGGAEDQLRPIIEAALKE